MIVVKRSESPAADAVSVHSATHTRQAVVALVCVEEPPQERMEQWNQASAAGMQQNPDNVRVKLDQSVFKRE